MLRGEENKRSHSPHVGGRGAADASENNRGGGVQPEFIRRRGDEVDLPLAYWALEAPGAALFLPPRNGIKATENHGHISQASCGGQRHS